MCLHIVFRAANSKRCEEQLHIDIDVVCVAETDVKSWPLLCVMRFPRAEKAVQNTSGMRAVRNLAAYEVEVGGCAYGQTWRPPRRDEYYSRRSGSTSGFQ